MKRFLARFKLKNIVLALTFLLALLLSLILTVISNSQINKLLDQNVAKRWGNISKVAQVSVFISKDQPFAYYDVRSFEEQLKAKLTEASIVSESENANARLWMDAYSCKGTISIEGKSGKATPIAYAVGGDFFAFHPLMLVNGSYFSSQNVMQDYILLDKELAWQLFGSDDIVGQQVWCGNIPLMVAGVYERGEGRLNDRAGNEKPTAYVSYDTYSMLESAEGGVNIDCYEIVLPNPVKGFGLKMMQDNFNIAEGTSVMLENSTRFGILSLLQVIRDFGTRSMGTYSIIYPYWENIARGMEDILALLMLVRCILLLYSFILLVIFIVVKIKSIPFKEIGNRIADIYDDYRSGKRELPKLRIRKKETKLKEE